MDEPRMLVQRDEDELESEVFGRTSVLTVRGWEDSEYIEPDDDWVMLEDGSYLSPAGAIRTWPAAAGAG
jgi:hypothetical protein